VAGIVARVGLSFGPLAFLGPFAGIFTPIATAGITAAGIGIGCIFLADNLWLLWVSAAGSVVAWGLYHRADLRRWLGYRAAARRTTATDLYPHSMNWNNHG
jgi:hypothetical protein